MDNELTVLYWIEIAGSTTLRLTCVDHDTALRQLAKSKVMREGIATGIHYTPYSEPDAGISDRRSGL